MKNQRFTKTERKIKLEKSTIGLDTGKTKNKGNLKGHIETVHEKKQLVRCNMCDRKVTAKDKLKRHRLLNHSHQCDNYEKKFTIVFDLNNHNASIHSIFKKKPFQCSCCNVKVTSKVHLKRHIENIHMRTKSL